MKRKLTFKEYIAMFLTFLKLGSLSFGGGNTMVSMLEGELIDKKKWITAEELMEMIAVAEVTPGPIAINIATYIGYKRGGLLGALMTTLGILIPPVICMFVLATFLGTLQKIEAVNFMLDGLKCAVLILLVSVSISLVKRTKIDWIGIIVISLVAIAEILLVIFNVSISAIFFILGGAVLGLLIYGLIPKFKEKK